jgi:hypothetical protein
MRLSGKHGRGQARVRVNTVDRQEWARVMVRLSVCVHVLTAEGGQGMREDEDGRVGVPAGLSMLIALLNVEVAAKSKRKLRRLTDGESQVMYAYCVCDAELGVQYTVHNSKTSYYK